MSQKVGFWMLALLGSALIGPLPAWAGENEMMDILVHKLVQKGVLTREDARQIRKELAEGSARMAKARQAQAQDSAKKMAGGRWFETVKWKGDPRLRHETQKREPAADRNRERFRLRFWFTAKPVEPLRIGVRLATGTSGGPVSTNQSFDATFDKKSVFIDQAYAQYSPWDWLSLIGGKMDNPLETTDIVWDGDVTPEGLAALLQSPSPLPGILG